MDRKSALPTDSISASHRLPPASKRRSTLSIVFTAVSLALTATGAAALLVVFYINLTTPGYTGPGAWISLRNTISSSCHHAWNQKNVCSGATDPDQCRFEQRINHTVDSVLSSTPLIDTHIDTPISIRVSYGNHIQGDNFTFATGLDPAHHHVDIPRLHRGRLGGFFWSAFVPCPTGGSLPPFPNSLYTETLTQTLQQLDLTHRIINRYPDVFAFTPSPVSLRAAHKAGKIGSVIGIEGLHQIANSAGNLRLFHRLGVRYVTLTHVCNNLYADGALAPEGEYWNGLNPKQGAAMVKEMNRLGMMVDLSHVTVAVMRDVLKTTRAPVIFSHSGAFSVCSHDRNVPDDVLLSLKENRGVIQVVFAPPFVRCNKDDEEGDVWDADLEDVVKHVEYIAGLIGWEHVGIGSDFDGLKRLPKGLEDVSKYPELFKELARRGATEKQLRGLAGENLLRVWEEVEKVGEMMRREGVVELEDEVDRLF